MNAFAGFFDCTDSLKEEKYLWMALVKRMARRQSHRGGAADRLTACCSAQCAMAQAGEAVTEGKKTAVCFEGILEGREELRRELGGSPDAGDGELAAAAYGRWAEKCGARLRGCFALAVDDRENGRLFLCRDGLGARPLFYWRQGDRMAFSLEVKGLLEYPGVNPVADWAVLREVLACAPDCGGFWGIQAVKPGQGLLFDRAGLREASSRPAGEIPSTRGPGTIQEAPFTAQQLYACLLEGVIARDLPGLPETDALVLRQHRGQGQEGGTVLWAGDGPEPLWQAGWLELLWPEVREALDIQNGGAAAPEMVYRQKLEQQERCAAAAGRALSVCHGGVGGQPVYRAPESYRQLLREKLGHVLQDSGQPLHKLFAPKAVAAFLAEPSGQSQGLAAWLLQINYWLLHYDVFLGLKGTKK